MCNYHQGRYVRTWWKIATAISKNLILPSCLEFFARKAQVMKKKSGAV